MNKHNFKSGFRMKIKSIFFVLFIAVLFLSKGFAQEVNRPKLVVGIIVDQMRYDYLYKFKPFYCKDGFNRLMNEGANFTYAHFNYVPTFTGPGHTSVYTGTTPFYHGIIANNWYDRRTCKKIYCVEDKSQKSVGSEDKEGEMSPRLLEATTITDQLKLATNMASKVISISLKDRAAILPGGHAANAAYWYDGKTGSFITSTYYMRNLPDWVDKFNARKLADKYMSREWSLSRPDSDYQITAPDNSPYEKDVFQERKTTFPHAFNYLSRTKKYSALESTPYGNSIVEQFVKAALVNEKLGQGKQTDFLAVSFSSTDYVGHDFGNNSYELEDTYIKLDSLVADLLKDLDNKVGKGNYLLFLTADHAALTTPGYLKAHKLPQGGLNTKKTIASVDSFLVSTYGDKNIIANYSNNQIYLNREIIKEKKLDIHKIMIKISDYLRDNFPEIASIFTRDDLEKLTPNRTSTNLTMNGYNPARSGDIAITLQPAYLPDVLSKGTTHGAPYNYDTHVPLLFYGWHIPGQTVNTPVYTVDIAATIADLLKIQEPDACIGIPLIK